MERIDYRIPDFQTPLLPNISDIQNSTEYTNHIHRSIDTLRSLTDRATLNVTLAAQQQNITDGRGGQSPNVNNHRILDRISPNDRLSSMDHHRLLDPNARISPELESSDDRHRIHSTAQHEQQRYLNNYNNDFGARSSIHHRGNDESESINVAQDYQERNQRIHETNDYQFNRNTNDFNSVKNEFPCAPGNGAPPSAASSSADNRYNNYHSANNTSDEHFRQNNRHNNDTINNNKSCAGDGGSYSNSSPSSPGTPISIEGGNNFKSDGEKVFGSKADLQLHTQMHMREAKPYKCSQCCKAFANSSYLSQHTRIHLGIKPYRCEICQRKFTQLSHLQQHIRTHTGDKPYKCRHPGCQKAFSQLSNLQSHSRCHQTDKPYKCNSCYKCFSDEPSLLEHIPKHKESKHLKTHICQYCGKSYTQETYLQKHMQKHSERVDKRPPITGAGGPLTGLNRNLLAAVSAAGVASLESPYWSKLSPDTMSSLDLERLEYHNHHNSAALTSNAAALLLERNSGTNLGLLDRSSNSNVQNLHLEHRNTNYGGNNATSARQQNQTDANQAFGGSQTRQNTDTANNENIPENNGANAGRTAFDTTNNLNKTHPDRNSSNPGSQHNNNNHDNIGEDLVVSNRHCRVNSPPNDSNVGGGNPGGPNGTNTSTYDTNKSGYEISISRSVANSAFTPISGINHINLNHPMGRPYLYDALSFQNKELNLNLNKSAGNSNAFPNQLISLHQIRNYAHQPSSIGSTEHILGLKDK
ncbi:zinc finger protein rotund-like isoform X2 [Chrysoperla carnea]|uniref:zinc finger protein rotund-like isoform X2 n=1 Tax=Chrysoperla carnea TaxID=189513 RepID=UPI001D066C34|nr:zinc finger protein rotund-like isoform X2 [Chrysoperla carnea]